MTSDDRHRVVPGHITDRIPVVTPTPYCHTCLRMIEEKPAIPKEPSMAAFIREDVEGGCLLHVLGEVDLANADEFQTAAMEIAGKKGDVIIDLTACTYMDSSGLRVIATMYKALEDRMRIVIPKGGSVHRIFEITGLAGQFNACESVDGALRKR